MKFLIVVFALTAVASANQYARTLSQTQEVQPDSYHYSYAVDNGIQAEESGNAAGATGRASWTSPEGIPVHFSYTADENGYHATGSHVPETPHHVLRALEYIRSQPAYDDSYTVHAKSGHYKPQVKTNFGHGFQKHF